LTGSAPEFLARWAMPAVAAILFLSAALAAASAASWPLIHDAPLIHYVVFLMEHGRAPYRDIIEMNMPGTYMTEWAAMHLFGGGATGWWLYDLTAGIGAMAASAWIAGAGRRSAGIAAGAMAYLVHVHEGPGNLGQRDWLIAALLLAAFGCMFEAIRRQRPAWMAGFMGLCVVAASIKPPVLVYGICFLAATCGLVRRGQRKDAGAELDRSTAWSQPGWLAYAAWAIAGGAVPAALVAAFLLRWGVTRELLATMHGLVPWYATLQKLPLPTLVHYGFAWNRSVFWVLAGGAIVAFLARPWRRWESHYLAGAALLGMGLYVMQGKGWAYHLYTETAFGLLWAMLELGRGLGWGRYRGAAPGLAGIRLEQVVATATLAFAVAMYFPRAGAFVPPNALTMETITHLENDLASLGGPELSGKVQCLDMTQGGCINTLYRMKLVQATGSVYDFYLFPKEGNAVTAELQQRFLGQLAANQPKVIVLSSHIWPGDRYGYDQVNNWPAFAEMLSAGYKLDREFPKPKMGAGYRIYVAK
jgi:hypothetical protein